MESKTYLNLLFTSHPVDSRSINSNAQELGLSRYSPAIHDICNCRNPPGCLKHSWMQVDKGFLFFSLRLGCLESYAGDSEEEKFLI